MTGIRIILNFKLLKIDVNAYAILSKLEKKDIGSILSRKIIKEYCKKLVEHG